MFTRRARLHLIGFLAFLGVLASPWTARAENKWVQIGKGISGANKGTNDLSGRLAQVSWAYDNAQGKNVVWAGASHGGLWKSIINESGNLVGWTPITDNFPPHTLASFAIRYYDSDYIVLGTGSNWGSGDGIHYTTDGGSHWYAANQPSRPGRVSRIVADRSDGTNETLVAATSDGIWQSYDFGQHWVSRLSGVQATDVVQDTGDASLWYAAIQKKQIYRSTDDGVSWKSYGTGISGGKARISLAACDADPNYLYALVIANGNKVNGVYRSAKRGETWVKIYSNDSQINPDHQGPHVSAIACDPGDPAHVFFGAVKAAEIKNATAKPASVVATLINGGHDDYNSMLFSADGNHLHIGSDGGYFYYDIRADNADSSGNLLGLNNMELGETPGLVSGASYSLQGGLASSYSNPDVFAAGLQDNDVVRGNISADPATEVIGGGDGRHVSIMPGDARVMAFTGNFANVRNLSYDAGKSIAPVDFNLTKEKTAPILIDPTPGLTNPKMFTANFDFVYFNDALEPASPWEQVGPPIPVPDLTSLLSNIDMTANPDRYQIAATVAGTPYVYLYHGPRAQLGALTLSSIGPLDGFVLCGASADGRINADRSKRQPSTLYYTTGRAHFTDCTTDGVEVRYAFVSRNAGSDWTDVTGDIATASGNADLVKLIGNPGDEKEFFLATSKGVFRGEKGDDGTVHWTDYSEGLRYHENVDDIVINFDNVSGNPTLYVATRGRGFWRRTIE